MKQTVLVTIEYGAHHRGAIARSKLRQIGDVYSLDAPEDWPTEVWTAFERARSARITANVASNTARQDGGHALQHPGERAQ